MLRLIDCTRSDKIRTGIGLVSLAIDCKWLKWCRILWHESVAGLERMCFVVLYNVLYVYVPGMYADGLNGLVGFVTGSVRMRFASGNVFQCFSLRHTLLQNNGSRETDKRRLILFWYYFEPEHDFQHGVGDLLWASATSGRWMEPLHQLHMPRALTIYWLNLSWSFHRNPEWEETTTGKSLYLLNRIWKSEGSKYRKVVRSWCDELWWVMSSLADSCLRLQSCRESLTRRWMHGPVIHRCIDRFGVVT